MSDPKPTTIVLNGFWAKIAQAILIAAVLSGASGLMIAYRQSFAHEELTKDVAIHEAQIEDIQDRLGRIDAGVAVLLDRTDPTR